VGYICPASKQHHPPTGNAAERAKPKQNREMGGYQSRTTSDCDEDIDGRKKEKKRKDKPNDSLLPYFTLHAPSYKDSYMSSAPDFQ